MKRRTAPVARELARYQMGIAALSETRFSEQDKLEVVGAGYTFFLSDHPQAVRRDAGVAFAIRTDIVGRLPYQPDKLAIPRPELTGLEEDIEDRSSNLCSQSDRHRQDQKGGTKVTNTVDAQDLPTSAHCQRTFRMPISLVRHLWTQ
ncbi:unnamed protein product [Schistocephalus solidus]|uniref:Uncharacterized protein n=1 Tax=Schistocephalus solidus TaxID=70667 RepID=A0A183TMV3_SCHSO|nr:unnamed protein product [Schistocephalus solidus]